MRILQIGMLSPESTLPIAFCKTTAKAWHPTFCEQLKPGWRIVAKRFTRLDTFSSPGVNF
jgi:hypothetical protein